MHRLFNDGDVINAVHLCESEGFEVLVFQRENLVAIFQQLEVRNCVSRVIQATHAVLAVVSECEQVALVGGVFGGDIRPLIGEVRRAVVGAKVDDVRHDFGSCGEKELFASLNTLYVIGWNISSLFFQKIYFFGRFRSEEHSMHA